jgi:hypothetical protein
VSTDDRRDQIIEFHAVNPDGDLACDFTIARDLAREGFRERLMRDIVAPVRPLPDGVEVQFRLSAWDNVRRYLDVESRCCSFLNLSATETADAIIVTVTGRPNAREFILNIFTSPDTRHA